MGVKGDRDWACAELGCYRSAHEQKRDVKHPFVQKKYVGSHVKVVVKIVRSKLN